ncbi:MAG: hypothetical protein AAF961_07025 [Planctomycetota bacterium]
MRSPSKGDRESGELLGRNSHATPQRRWRKGEVKKASLASEVDQDQHDVISNTHKSRNWQRARGIAQDGDSNAG